MKLVLIGGFLGSGKTTAIVGACKLLMEQGKAVGVITNDQGNQQVDTAWVHSLGITGKEVANGCFCCNYNQLDDHLRTLLKENHPDVVFAESVGTCTDLIATIARPMNKCHPEIDVVISIFSDGGFLSSLLEGTSTFMEESVRYIFKKQLEEADILVINKVDLLSATQLSAVDAQIRKEYPGKIIRHQNSLTEDGLFGWLNEVNRLTALERRGTLELDYGIYGEGEAKLAWLDKSIEIRMPDGDAIKICHKVIGSTFDQIQRAGLPIGHLKFFIESGTWTEKISFTSTGTSSGLPHADHSAHKAKMLINARIETDPGVLQKLVDDVLDQIKKIYGCSMVMGKWDVFKPGFPRPTHRMVG